MDIDDFNVSNIDNYNDVRGHTMSSNKTVKIVDGGLYFIFSFHFILPFFSFSFLFFYF